MDVHNLAHLLEVLGSGVVRLTEDHDNRSLGRRWRHICTAAKFLE